MTDHLVSEASFLRTRLNREFIDYFFNIPDNENDELSDLLKMLLTKNHDDTFFIPEEKRKIDEEAYFGAFGSNADYFMNLVKYRNNFVAADMLSVAKYAGYKINNFSGREFKKLKKTRDFKDNLCCIVDDIYDIDVENLDSDVSPANAKIGKISPISKLESEKRSLFFLQGKLIEKEIEVDNTTRICTHQIFIAYEPKRIYYVIPASYCQEVAMDFDKFLNLKPISKK